MCVVGGWWVGRVLSYSGSIGGLACLDPIVLERRTLGIVLEHTPHIRIALVSGCICIS